MDRYTLAPVRHGTVSWAEAQALVRTPLTAVQNKIIAFVHRYQRLWGATPLYREIAVACGLASDSAVAYQIGRLMRLGMLHKPPRRHRALVLKVVPVSAPARPAPAGA